MRVSSLLFAISATVAAAGIGGCATHHRPSMQRLPLVATQQSPGESPARVDRDVRPVHSLQEAMEPELDPTSETELIPPPPRDNYRGTEPSPGGPKPPDDGLRPIGKLTVGIAPPPVVGAAADQSGLPADLALERFGDQAPLLAESEPFAPWDAYGQLVLSSDFCHRPLYFEDINLERYGRSHGIAQPFVSAARFYAAVPALPYKLVAEPPTVCMRDNSRWPAGGYGPHHRNLPPFDAKAGLVEAATIVGLILLIP